MIAITESPENQLLADYSQALDRAEQEIPESKRAEYRNRIDAAFRIAMEQLQGCNLDVQRERIQGVRNSFNHKVVSCVDTFKEKNAMGLLERIGSQFLKQTGLPLSIDLESRMMQQMPFEAREYCSKVVKVVSAQLGGKSLPNEEEVKALVGREVRQVCGRECPGMVLMITRALQAVGVQEAALQFPLMP